MGRILVTGIGIISAIGNSANENRSSLTAGRSGITMNSQNFFSRYSGLLPFGEVNVATGVLKEGLQVRNKGVTRTTLLALHAFNEAVADAGLTENQVTSFDTALITGNTVGGMCLTNNLYEDGRGNAQSPEYLSSYDFASVSLYLQSHNQIHGIVNTFNTACSSSANAIMYGCRLIKNGLAKRAIVGGTDSLSKFTVNGFNALRILSGQPCRPFDESRDGLNLGEGAAFLVLEREDDAAGKNIYGAVAGYGNTNDAYHPSSLSDEATGPRMAMQCALAVAKLEPSDIGLINAHGTGTENNDKVESRAMLDIFGQPPAFSSTKSYTGHTLGAAGAIEAVYSLFNLHYQEAYPNLQFGQPITGTGLKPLQAYQKLPVKHVMSNSFGFGGNCTSLIFSRV